MPEPSTPRRLAEAAVRPPSSATEPTEFDVSHGALGAKYFDISPGYLEAAETRLIAGRDFTWQDDQKSPKVAVVNQTFAHKLFGNASAIGQHFMTGKDDRYQIVGIVEDGKYDSLTEDPWPAVFTPWRGPPTAEQFSSFDRNCLQPMQQGH